MAWDELPGQLERFATILRREQDTRRTADFIATDAGRLQAQWAASRRLSATGVPVPLPRDQGLHPAGCELQACWLSFRFEAAENGRPLCAEFQMQVEGWLIAGDALFELQDHWRIDTEPPMHASAGREPHPNFHFQRGGRTQDGFAGQEGFIPSRLVTLGDAHWRCLMQCPGPRIPTLPFDPILAIDFCVAQNDGPLWRRLRDVPEYFNVIEEAQKRLWQPFLESLGGREGRRDWLGPLVAI